VPIAETVNAEDSWCNTPLTIATKTGQYEMAKLLLDKGTEVNTQGGFYGNALNAASSEGHEQVVKMLLNAGAHPLQ
jgi:ankyrin repeat protein